jgi:hypothetical protein
MLSDSAQISYRILISRIENDAVNASLLGGGQWVSGFTIKQAIIAVYTFRTLLGINPVQRARLSSTAHATWCPTVGLARDAG